MEALKRLVGRAGGWLGLPNEVRYDRSREKFETMKWTGE